MPGSSHLLEAVKVRGDKQALPADRPGRGAGGGGADRRARAASLELPARRARAAGPAGVRSRSGARRGFAEVIEGALEVRERLEALGLKTFCKTTGGKGLHVVVPLTPDRKSPDWDDRQDVRQGDLPAAGRRRARALRAQHGEEGAHRPHLPRLSAQRPHLDRGGAAVAARAAGRPGLDAARLDAGEGRASIPRKYTVRTAPALLKKSKPWADYARSAKPLRAAIERLIKSKS